MTEVTTLRRFDIVSNSDEWAAYHEVQDIEVGKADPLAEIERMAADSNMPAGIRLTALHPERPERFLDIHEHRPDGEYTYVFHLNHKPLPDGKYRTHFADVPITVIGVGSEETKRFFLDISRTNPQWARLTVDVGAIRNSDMAKALRSKEFKSIQIPFHFNMIDKKLGFSPGVLPNEHPHRTAKMKRPDFTHGGIHPPMASFYDLTL